MDPVHARTDCWKVLVSHFDHRAGRIVHRSVNACIAPLCSVADKAITTIEGISSAGKLHPIQERLVESNGSQCGFCTPGIVMSVYSLLQSEENPTLEQLESSLDGNLCRCTGYRPIVDALSALCRTSCGNANGDIEDIGKTKAPLQQTISDPDLAVANDPNTVAGTSKAPASLNFPKDLIYKVPTRLVLGQEEDSTMWFRPITMKELLYLKDLHRSNARIAVGFTELGIEKHFKRSRFPSCISPVSVPEMTAIRISDVGLELGAAVTISDLDAALAHAIDTMDPLKTIFFKEFRQQIRRFAGHSVRNVGSIGGNLITASPISDLNPLHSACSSILTFESMSRGARTTTADKLFITYRVVDCRDDEVLVKVTIPFSPPPETHFRAFKVSRRRDDDIAIVCAGMFMRLHPVNRSILQCSLAFGGMAPVTLQAKETSRYCIGKTFSSSLFKDIIPILQRDLPLPDNAPGGMAHYRRTLALSLVLKFFLAVSGNDSRDSAATSAFTRPPCKGLQYFNVSPPLPSECIGKGIAHKAGKLHVTGTATYSDDTAVRPRALYAALVTSTKPHALLRAVRWEKALAAPGVHSYLDHESVPGSNAMGPVVLDEELFASKEVHCVGAVIGAVLADTDEHAQDAARLVEIDYEPLPFVLTIQEAIAAGSFFEPLHPLSIETGNLDAALQRSEVIVEGAVNVGAQEHFYMEPQTCIATPGEDNEIEVVTSTQNPTKAQTYAAKALGIERNRVVVRVKRLGGGFGGKETRSVFVSSIAAVGAAASRRQVRCVLPRDVDMCITGTRHAFYATYRIGSTRDGYLQAADIQLYSNGGCSQDLSVPVMERAIFHAENAYLVPALRCVGKVCRTNTPSNTAFRGFGGPQSMFIAETWMEHLARTLSIDRHDLIRRNLLRAVPDSMTYFGQAIPDCPLTQMWSDLMRVADVENRRAEAQRFNSESKYVKKGIACVPTKFGMSFTLKFMNQASALVHVYTDGTVLVSHGGTEMGQGLHTKMCAVAAHELGIGFDQVHISETATDKVANTQPTAASVSADLNGAAIQDACRQINERLAPFRAQLPPEATFAEVVTLANFNRACLSAYGFYRTPDLDFSWESGKGRPFHYFSYGVACAEVQLDCLTGDILVQRVDIIHDVGDSLNPTIDIGQIEGGFVQGYGLFCLEELVTTPQGALFTRGPSTYKIPSCTDIPVDFRVTLHQDESRATTSKLTTIYSSKGVGEPPLFLGSSVFFAAKEAVYAYRDDPSYFQLDSPATCERLRLACSAAIGRNLYSDSC
ncbi:FAD-binding PCMH-type domain-containing protein [Plasmodiophora brassicae]|uniref:FAD-binding PCMH-type domain-containing protein n=1 Tax=Plasmodiophora brassicae TaxID=37360 RepID=A0A0G4IL22_PLABS|nr:hypothetical protein PBRA_004508 [Plasmodiophora brassicae]